MILSSTKYPQVHLVSHQFPTTVQNVLSNDQAVLDHLTAARQSSVLGCWRQTTLEFGAKIKMNTQVFYVKLSSRANKRWGNCTVLQKFAHKIRLNITGSNYLVYNRLHMRFVTLISVKQGLTTVRERYASLLPERSGQFEESCSRLKASYVRN